MLTINEENHKIYLTCGDSAKLSVGATQDDGTPYQYVANDKVVFTVKSSTDKTDDDKLIEKTTTATTSTYSLDIFLDPEDTKDLEFTKYYYDIQLIKANGWTDTIVEKAIFEIGVEIG